MARCETGPNRIRRTNLLRAAILGPSGTPYHDGLFVFDVRLPPDYPASPPEVYYHSWGLRVNPVRGRTRPRCNAALQQNVVRHIDVSSELD